MVILIAIHFLCDKFKFFNRLTALLSFAVFQALVFPSGNANVVYFVLNSPPHTNLIIWTPWKQPFGKSSAPTPPVVGSLLNAGFGVSGEDTEESKTSLIYNGGELNLRSKSTFSPSFLLYT